VISAKYAHDKRPNLEPTLIVFELKVSFNNDKSMKITTNWKTDSGWQDESEIDDTDWIDSRLVNVTLHFDGSSLNVFDNSNSLITEFKLNYELDKIYKLQLFGGILKLKSICLKYDNARKQ
jgi:hypothetical protein